MAAKGNSVGVGELIDASEYAGPNAYGSFAQPFWDGDIEILSFDENGQQIFPPLYSESAWDRIQLGAYLLPGIWEASATPALKLDIQTPKGFDGAAIITRGYLPPRITLTGLLWTSLQWFTFQQILPAIWTRPFKVAAQDVVVAKRIKIDEKTTINVEKQANNPPTTLGGPDAQIVGKQRSLAVASPPLNAVGISALVIESIATPVPHSIPGVMKITLQCIEYVSPPPVLPSATRNVQGPGKGRERGPNAFDNNISERDVRVAKAPSKSKKALEP